MQQLFLGGSNTYSLHFWQTVSYHSSTVPVCLVSADDATIWSVMSSMRASSSADRTAEDAEEMLVKMETRQKLKSVSSAIHFHLLGAFVSVLCLFLPIVFI